jgi:hypothetical protein
MTADLTTARWKTSSRSAGNGGQCVEVGPTGAVLDPDAVAVRDSKNRDGGTLVFDPAAWAAFTGAVKAGNL